MIHLWDCSAWEQAINRDAVMKLTHSQAASKHRDILAIVSRAAVANTYKLLQCIISLHAAMTSDHFHIKKFSLFTIPP
jgi:hypothetical protein